MEQVKDDKKFFHVFPTLRADDDVRLLFSDVEVKKITTNSRRDFLNIYIFSRHLIQKKQIFQMEQCIKDQLFAKTAVAVHIVEEYMLSGQYTAEALMNEYRESIILELKEKSMPGSARYDCFGRAKRRDSGAVKGSVFRKISYSGRDPCRLQRA